VAGLTRRPRSLLCDSVPQNSVPQNKHIEYRGQPSRACLELKAKSAHRRCVFLHSQKGPRALPGLANILSHIQDPDVQCNAPELVDSKTPAATSNPQSLSCGAPRHVHTLHCIAGTNLYLVYSYSTTIHQHSQCTSDSLFPAFIGSPQTTAGPPLHWQRPALFEYFEPDLPLSHANEPVSIFELASDNPGQPTPISLERLEHLEHAVAELWVSSSNMKVH
jgi:hypothetical protein